MKTFGGRNTRSSHQQLYNMKKLVSSLTAGLLVLGAQSLFAQTTTPTTPGTSDTPAAHSGQTADQRKARQELMKILGLDPKELKGLSREDRAAKVKEAAKKYVADMKEKKAAGTLTADEKTDLAKVEKFLAGGHKKAKPAADTQ
jgi:hypothetical protein